MAKDARSGPSQTQVRFDRARKTTEEAMAIIDLERDALRKKTERLRELRLAKEAAETPPPAKKPAIKKLVQQIVTKKPAAKTVAVKEPVAKKPTAKKAAAKRPVAKKPAAKKAATKKPAAKKPVAKKAAAKKAASKKPSKAAKKK